MNVGEEAAEPWEAISYRAKVLAEIAWTKHGLLRVSLLAATVGGGLVAAAVASALAAGGVR
jgi:hypothetical protein